MCWNKISFCWAFVTGYYLVFWGYQNCGLWNGCQKMLHCILTTKLFRVWFLLNIVTLSKTEPRPKPIQLWFQLIVILPLIFFIKWYDFNLLWISSNLKSYSGIPYNLIRDDKFQNCFVPHLSITGLHVLFQNQYHVCVLVLLSLGTNS